MEARSEGTCISLEQTPPEALYRRLDYTECAKIECSGLTLVVKRFIVSSSIPELPGKHSHNMARRHKEHSPAHPAKESQLLNKLVVPMSKCFSKESSVQQ